jgi:hypothetical protein
MRGGSGGGGGPAGAAAGDGDAVRTGDAPRDGARGGGSGDPESTASSIATGSAAAAANTAVFKTCGRRIESAAVINSAQLAPDWISDDSDARGDRNGDEDISAVAHAFSSTRGATKYLLII